MSLLVLGMNHRSTDFGLLERVAVPADELPKALRSLTALEHVVEATVLSTCNRVEVYAHVSRFHDGLAELLSWLAARGDLAMTDLDGVHYGHYDERAAEHLFAVASGLDSLVVGEQQIAVQVREAAKAAKDEGAARRVLQRLFDQALYVSRRVRGETDITQGVSSLVDVGLDAAADCAGSLADRTVLLVGAGTIGSLTAERLVRDRAGCILVRNRTAERADRLARRVGGEVVGDGGLRQAVAAADVVVCCTGASAHLLDADLVGAAVEGRDRPLVVVDLAMPRNVDPLCGDLAGVTLIDLETIREVADRSVTGDVVLEASAIVSDEAARFRAWLQAVRIEPTIRALRQRAEQVRNGELGRLSSRLAGLDERQREAVEALTHGIVNTLLHDPTVRLKALADRGGAEHYAIALRELFDLDE
ncbi:MAG: glutamyl-tRNA reductase [Actinobacteria bacterium]|nr:glutamyl-tRNA reductase [Actinomycetota bacterium]